jgi:alkaline phosphatase D
MMMDLDRRTGEEPEPIYSLDSWAGYQRPRHRMLEMMRGLGNVVVLTGDEHQNYAGQLILDGNPVAIEFVGTSISSGGDGQDLRPGSDQILKHNPHLEFINDQRGYLLCTIGREEWRTDFLVIDKVSSPDGQMSKRASFLVERGRPALEKA